MDVQEEIKNLKVFSKKLKSYINVFPSDGGLIPAMENASWMDKGWSNSSGNWMDNGWNNSYGNWTDNGWSNSSNSWTDSGWNNSGSGGGGCYITTAAVDHLGLADDCAELNMLRMYRDKLVEEDPEFRKLVLEYYKTAPQIVKEISNSSDKEIVLDSIYTDMVLPVLDLLKQGKTNEAKEHYLKVYNNLKSKYVLKPQEQISKKH